MPMALSSPPVRRRVEVSGRVWVVAVRMALWWIGWREDQVRVAAVGGDGRFSNAGSVGGVEVGCGCCIEGSM
jgi:hypothetical protein